MTTKVVKFLQKNPFVSFSLTLIGIILYQCLNLFWGFELADSGFHLTAFDNIFDAPDSVSYNFMYYLTNVIGGGIMKLLPNIGILGFRVVGAALVDIALLLIFCSLRKDIPIVHLLIGGILVVMSYIQIPYSFNNGICTCFLYVCALLLLYKGLVSERSLLIFYSGIFVGINIFSRIPNLLAVGLVLIVLLHNYIEGSKQKSDWRSAWLFLLGVILGIIIMLVLINSLGHSPAFLETINVLFRKGTSSSDAHSAGLLIWVQLYFYLNAIIFVSLFFAVNHIDRKLERLFGRFIFVGMASFAIFYHVYLNMGYEPLWAICMIGCVICLRRNGHIALLASLALYMLLIEILGSNSGNNHGSLPALLAAPVASYSVINRRNLLYVIVGCIALVMKVIKQGNYFDFGPLSQKSYTVSVQECSFLRTTKDRAEAINQSLPAIRSFVHPEDTLLVYGSAPMMNYLTHTRPAGGMCWPGEGFFVKPFETAPKILIHKFDDFAEPTRQTCGIPTGNQMLDAYIQEHQYQIVWENPYFILLFPQK